MNRNPYICDEPGTTLSYISHALGLAEKLMESAETVSLDEADVCAFAVQLQCMREAVDDTMAKLDVGDYKSKSGLRAI